MDAIRFGRGIRALRRRQLLRQVDLGDRARVSDSRVSLIERGSIGAMPFRTLHAVASALGAELQLQLRWRGEGLDRLLDEAHAAIVETVVARFRVAGWETIVEASFAVGGERGSIDVLARHAATGQIAVVEVKSVIPDVQAMIFGLDRKGRLAPIIAREHGWACLGVARFLFVAEGRTARRRVERHRSTFETAFPVRGREALAWLSDPAGRLPAALVFVVPAGGATSSNSRRARVRRSTVRRGELDRHVAVRETREEASSATVEFPPRGNLPVSG